MTSIIVGGGLGLYGSSATQQNGYGASGNAKIGQGNANAYVNAATGNLVIQSQDEYVAAVGLSDPVVATYNLMGSDGYNSDHWQFSFERSLAIGLLPKVLHGAITRTTADGDVENFTYNSTLKLWQAENGTGAYDTLNYTSTTWVYTQGSTGITETYSSSGQLLSETDQNGNTLTYNYNSSNQVSSIVDSSGQTTYLDYSGKNLTDIRVMGLVPGATGSTQTQQLVRVEYGYDSSNRLISTTVELTQNNSSTTFDSNVYTTTYQYSGSSDDITQIAQSDGSVLNIGYTLAGRVASVTDGQGNETKFSYDILNGTGTVTDAQGNVTTYTYDSKQRLTKVTQPTESGGTASISYTYNSDNSISQVTDADGNTVDYTYDGDGNLTEIQDSLGNTVTRTYDSSDRLLSETVYQTPALAVGDAASNPETTHYVYDGSGNLRFIITALGDVTEYRYNSQGERITSITYPAAVSTGPYTGVYSGPDTVTGNIPSLSDMTTWAAAQNQTEIRRTDTTYDLTGQIQTVTTWNTTSSTGSGVSDGKQQESRYVYNVEGQLLVSISPRAASSVPTSTSAAGQAYVTSYVYNGLNQLLSSTDGTGRVTVSNVYGRVTPSTTATGQDVSVQSTAANGLLTTTVYNAAGDVLSVSQTSSTGTVLGTTTYVYNADNQLIEETDPTGASTYYTYDAVGNRTGVITPQKELTETQYNNDGQVIATIQYANLVTVSNPAGDTISQVRPATSSLDRTTAYLYDAADRLIDIVDPDGYVTQYAYDGAGNTISQTQYNTPLSSIPTTGTASSISVTPELGLDRTTRYFYDADNQLIATLDPNGYLTETTYDDAGEAIKTTAYATLTTANLNLRATDTLAQLTPAANASQDQTSYTFYNGEGQVSATIDADGFLTANTYDLNGNLIGQTRYATAVSYSGSGAAPTPTTSAQDQTQTWVYDALNRLTRQTNAQGTITQYNYDPVSGFLTSKVSADGQDDELGRNDQRTTTYTYNELGEVTNTELGNSGSNTQSFYDADGRQTETIDPDGNKTFYYYDGDGRLVYTVNGAGEVTGSVYDAFGDVVQTTQYASRISLTGLVGGAVGSDSAFNTAIDASGFQGNAANRVTSYAYGDDRGLLTQTTDAMGFVTTQSYDAFGELASQTVNVGSTTSPTLSTDTYTYDADGNLLDSDEDSGGLNLYSITTYDAFGRVTHSQDPDGHTTTTTYSDPLGHTVTVEDLLGHTTVTRYDAFGRVVSQQDADGNVTTYAYNNATQTTTTTDPLGIVTTTIDNRQGQVIKTVDGNGAGTVYAYDLDGNLTSTTDPDGYVTTNTYDAADLLKTTVDANGTTTSYAYDAARRVSSKTVNPGGLGLLTGYTYDAFGDIATVTDPNGNATYSVFNNDGRLAYAIDPDGDVTAYQYNAAGEVARTTKYATPITLSSLPANPTVAQVAALIAGSTSDEVTTDIYDAAGRLAYSVDAAGDVTGYQRDADGNVIRTTEYVTQITPSNLQAISTPAQIAATLTASASNETATSVYDVAGRLVYQINALGDVTGYQYDANGNVIQTTKYATPITLSSLPANPTPAQVAALVSTNSSNAVTSSVYNADGEMVYSINALGDVTAYQYDHDGNVTLTTSYATPISLASLPATPTAAQVAALVTASAGDETTHSVYDADDRVVYQIDALGDVTAYQYDHDGNVTQTTKYATPITLSSLPANPTAAQVAALVTTSAKDQTTHTAYDADGRLKTVTDADNYTQSYTYDAFGNKKTYTNQDGNTWTYQYDALNRLTLQIDPATATYATNGSGQTVSVSLNSSSEQEAEAVGYDAFGNVISNIDGYVVASGGTETFTAMRATDYTYDLLNRQVQTVNAASSYFYQGENEPVAVNDAGVAVYNAAGDTASGYGSNPAQFETTQSLTTTTFYNGLGQAIAGEDAAGNFTYKIYNALGEVTAEIDGERGVTAYIYDAFGNQLTETRYATALNQGSSTSGLVELENAVRSAQTANPGNPGAAAVQAAVSAAQAQVVALVSALVGTANANNRTITTTYDKLNRKIQVTQPAVGYEFLSPSYASISGSASPTTKYAYDAFGDLTTQSSLLNPQANTWATTYYGYDLDGDQTNVIDPLGYYTQNKYDAFGNLIQTDQYAKALTGGSPATLPIFTSAAFLADVVATAANVASPNLYGYDRVVDYVYDNLNRQTSQTRVGVEIATLASNDLSATNTVGNATTSTTYDGVGNVLTTTDAQGNVTSTYYNALGEVIGVRQPVHSVLVNGTATSVAPLTVFQYDLLGDQIGQIAYASNVTANPTNTGGIPQAPNLDADAVTYTLHDILGRETETVQEDGSISANNSTYTAVVQDRAYDALGHVARIWEQQSLVSGGSQTKVQVFGYDRDGNQTSELDAVRTPLLEGSDVLTAGTGPSDVLTQSTFDTFGEQIQKTVENVNNATNPTVLSVDHYAYDANGRLWQTDQSGVDTVYEYDLQGNATAKILVPLQVANQQSYETTAYVPGWLTPSSSAPSAIASTIASITGGIQTSTMYDADGHIVTQINPSFQEAFGTVTGTILQSVDRWGNVIVSTDPAELDFSYNYYNDQNQIIKTVVAPVTGWETASGSTTGSFTATSVTLTPTTTSYYDSLGHEIASTDADGNTTTYVYDAAGEKVAEYTPMQVDGLAPSYSESSWGYDVLGQQSTAEDGNGNVTYSYYDQLNNLQDQTVVSPGGGIIGIEFYTYDQLGNRTSTLDGDGHTTRYAYDTKNELVYDLTPLTEYTQTDDGNFYNEYEYDGLGNKTTQFGDGGSQEWYYDGYGRLTESVSLAQNLSTYTYDAWGRLVNTQARVISGTLGSVVTGQQNLSYTYYANGAVDTITDNEGGEDQQVTTYQYDADGRQTVDQVKDAVTGTYLQNEQIIYNVLGWVSEIVDAGEVTQNYGYDANGNRIQIDTVPVSGSAQDDWYEYNARNEMVVVAGQGTLNSNGSYSVQLGITGTVGTWLGYDFDGNRNVSETNGVTTTYQYTSTGQLAAAYNSSGVATQKNTYDLAGNLIADQTLTGSGTFSYDANDYLIYQSTITSGNEDTVSYSENGELNGTPETGTALAGDPGYYNQPGQAYEYTEAVYTGENPTNTGTLNYTVTTQNTYEAVANSEVLYQQLVEINENNYHPSTATYTYDAQGNVVKISNPNPNNGVTQETFVNDPEGEMLKQTEVSNGTTLNQAYAYVDNSPVWSGGGISATTNYNYQPVSQQYPPANPGQYVVQGGDTLQSIALGEYGDASLWYLIADANGLQSDSQSQALQPGLTLTIPNQVTNVHNNVNTVAPYNPGQAIGSVNPVPQYVPPPSSGGSGGIGGILADIVVVIVVAVADYFGQEYANQLLPEVFSATSGAAAGAAAAGTAAASTAAVGVTATGLAIGAASAAVGAAVGDAAGQLVGDALGVNHGFNLGEVATSAVEGGLTAGLSGAITPVGAAVVANAAGQGINIALGNQHGFSWSGVAAAAVSAGVESELTSPSNTPSDIHTPSALLNPSGPNIPFSTSDVLYNTVVGFDAGVAGDATQVLLSGHGQIQFANIAADAFGNALGDSIVGQIKTTPGQTQLTNTQVNVQGPSLTGTNPLFNGINFATGTGIDSRVDLGLNSPIGALPDTSLNTPDIGSGINFTAAGQPAYQAVTAQPAVTSTSQLIAQYDALNAGVLNTAQSPSSDAPQLQQVVVTPQGVGSGVALDASGNQIGDQVAVQGVTVPGQRQGFFSTVLSQLEDGEFGEAGSTIYKGVSSLASVAYSDLTSFAQQLTVSDDHHLSDAILFPGPLQGAHLNLGALSLPVNSAINVVNSGVNFAADVLGAVGEPFAEHQGELITAEANLGPQIGGALELATSGLATLPAIVGTAQSLPAVRATAGFLADETGTISLSGPLRGGATSNVSLGEQIGAGQYKTVYVVQGDPSKVVALSNTGSLADLQSEVQQLNQLNGAGLPVVNNYGIVTAGDQPGILMDNLQGAINVKPAFNAPGVEDAAFARLGQNSVPDLQAIQGYLQSNTIGDFQVMVTPEGRVLLNDPAGLSPQPSNPYATSLINDMLEAAQSAGTR